MKKARFQIAQIGILETQPSFSSPMNWGMRGKNIEADLRDPVEKRKQEIEADAFAIEMMRRIAQVPVGLELVLC